MASSFSVKISFKPHWVFTLMTCVVVVLFLRLSYWQLERAAEKVRMVSAAQALALKSPILWGAQHALPAQYQPISLHGRFLSKSLLLDNQHYQHQFGLNVITPLLLNNGHVVLVDRGWVAADVTRRVLPKYTIPSGNVDLIGNAYYPSDKTWLLGPGFEIKNLKLIIIERINVEEISRLLHKSVYPFIMRLNKDSAYGYVREWPIVAMSVEKHYGYALQWFLFALVALILFVSLNIKKKT